MTVPGGEVKLLGIWDGSSHSWSSSSDTKSGLSTLRLDLRSSEKETNAVAAFVTEPRRLAVRIVGLRGRAADVKQVRFIVFTNHHRVVLPLPPIPNLPAEYQNVDNLFNVRIPQLNIEREYEFRQLLEETTQMKFAHTSWQDYILTNLFPMLRTNVPPRNSHRTAHVVRTNAESEFGARFLLNGSGLEFHSPAMPLHLHIDRRYTKHL